MTPVVTIRPLQSDEWELFRDLRIRAVTDSPDAFGAILDDVLSEPDEYWQSMAAGFAEERHSLLIGFVDAAAIGTTYVRRSDDGAGHIGAMWVDPGYRRRGLGAQLLRAGMHWHAAKGAKVVQLWVTEGNYPATQLYFANGFTMAGERQPLRDGSALDRLLMEYTVSPG